MTPAERKERSRKAGLAAAAANSMTKAERSAKMRKLAQKRWGVVGKISKKGGGN